MLGKVRSSGSFEDYKARSDISRLLDPSYTTSYYKQSTHGAYVDAQGNMHDPDYRAFPLIQQSSQHSPNKRATRPHWELVDEDALLLDDDEDLLLQSGDAYSKRNSYSSPRHYAPSHRSSSPSGGMRIYPRSTAFSGAILSHSNEVSPPTSWSSSSSSESSSPFSTCASQQSPFEGEEVKEKTLCRITSSLKKRRRRSAGSATSEKRASLDFDDSERLHNTYQEETVQEEEEGDEEEYGRRRVEEEDSVPTCAESMKKQWQALSLRVQFGMFRAERRIKRRVQSLI